MIILRIVKFLAIMTVIACFILSCTICSFFLRGKWQAKKVQVQIISFYCKLVLRILNVEVLAPDIAQYTGDNYLAVCNHLSYLDILVVASKISCCFVTSKEVKQTPFIGTITSNAGCLFVERRDKSNLSQEIAEITEALKQGLNVGIFPEATSTDGSEVLRFRRPLYTAAIDSQRQVLPMCLNYTSIDGVTVTKENRDFICWYGDMEFFPHFWNLCKIAKIKVRLDCFPPIVPNCSENTVLADASHAVVKRHFKPFI